MPTYIATMLRILNENNISYGDEIIKTITFLDDTPDADITAKKAGMIVCGVYDGSSKDYTENIKKATDHYIYNFSELLILQKIFTSQR